MGRPAFKEPSDRERFVVRGLSIMGMTQDSIADMLGISQDTLVKYFPDEIALGKAEAVAAMAGKLYEGAMQGNAVLQMFYLKCQGRWRERDELPAPAPPGDRANVGGAEPETLTVLPNGPKLGGLQLIGPTKPKPVNAKKGNGHAK